MSVMFIVWVVLTILLLIYPVSMLTKYSRIRGKKLYDYLVNHTQEMKAIKQFHQDGVMNKIKETELEDETNIFEEESEVKAFIERNNNHQSNLSEDDMNQIERVEDSSLNIRLGTDSSDQNKEDQSSDKVEPTSDWIAKNIKKVVKSYDVSEGSREEAQRRKTRIDKTKSEAEMLKNKGQFEDYEKKLIEGMSIDPKPAGYFKKQLADWYFHMGNYKKALTLLKQILAIEPRHHRSLWQVGEIHLEKGEFDVAKMLVQKAIELSPQNPKYYVTMVEILYNMDNLQHAIGLMHKVVKLRPKNISYLLGLAGLHESAKEKDEAKTIYMKIIQLDPSNEKARKKLKLFA